MGKFQLHSLRVTYESILALFLAMAALALIGALNRYVFMESNLPFLLILLILSTVIYGPSRVPKDMWFPWVTVSLWLFILYSWFRLDNWWDFEIRTENPDGTKPGFLFVIDLVIFHFLFVVAAILFYKQNKVSVFLWFLIVGYVIAFIIRNSSDIAALQEGYNLSPGLVLVTLLPFIFLENKNNNQMPIIPSALLFLCMIWLAFIGARTAVGTLLIFYIGMRAWPIIARSRFMYFSAFWGMVLGIAVLTILYLLYALDNPADPLLRESLVEGSGVGFFQKGIGTRQEIWLHLLYLISQEPMLGYGADHATSTVTPLSFMIFTFRRDDLAANSTYFEVLYRLGIVGILGFILIMFSIWKSFWDGREQWAVRVAGAFLLCMLFFASTGEYFVFSTVELRSGFGWIILGIGAGACLRARKEARIRSAVDSKDGAMRSGRPANDRLAISKRYWSPTRRHAPL